MPTIANMSGVPGYFRYPSVAGQQVVFVSEDDLWTVPLEGGRARRLTAGWGTATKPRLSPDGMWCAFTGREEGDTEVYIMPGEGGAARRLTYLGATTTVAAWAPDGRLVVASNAKRPFRSWTELWIVDPESGTLEPMGLGPAASIGFGPGNRRIIGRNTADPALWKRYRGGRAGAFWIDCEGDGQWEPFSPVPAPGNLASPMWLGERIYFLSDHEGIANLYSVLPSGKDLSRHTDHDTYYARGASSDGHTIVYHVGADVWRFDPAKDVAAPIPIDYRSQRTQREIKYPDPVRFWTGYRLNAEGRRLLVTTRGKLFAMDNWEGPVLALGEPQGVRYRLASWLPEGNGILAVSDRGGEEQLELLAAGPLDGETPALPQDDFGRILNMAIAPQGRFVALANHRMELWLLDLEESTARVIDRSRESTVQGMDWSSDGRWLAYSLATGPKCLPIKLYDRNNDQVHVITRPIVKDFAPVFDPEGRYLYFLSARVFDPVYDSLKFDLGFPAGIRPYCIPLRGDLPSPFLPGAAAPKERPKTTEEHADEDDKETPSLVIDVEGMADRLVPFPVPEGRYHQLAAAPGKIFFTKTPIEGSLGASFYTTDPEPTATLSQYDLGDKKTQDLAHHVSGFEISPDRKILAIRSGGRLRVVRAGEKVDESKQKPGQESGLVDFSRITVPVLVEAEWQQMLREAWRLMRDNFWVADMSGVDWDVILERYRSLLPKVSTRSEFSDLVWEMQGELGTSHAYEMGGDYRSEPQHPMGFLAADSHWEADPAGYVIDHIVQGTSWQEGEDSPLRTPGASVCPGDVILAVDGRATSPQEPPEALLVNRSRDVISLTIKQAEATRQVVVRALDSELGARYREWVNKNRAHVHARSEGRIGYVHIPDMGPRGYAEFYRGFLPEAGRDGLIVDVRFNGGGHVSSLILQTLSRRRLGYDVPRHGYPESYPIDSLEGPVVAITNEHAGSDGDIFSHSFKMLGLGPLVGHRTWGGVIGIWVRHALVDNSVTTQPEFSFWFRDVGWGVENYGTDPTVPLDNSPQDYANGVDAQLDRAVELAMADLAKRPAGLPDFGPRPRLSLPHLPPRSR